MHCQNSRTTLGLESHAVRECFSNNFIIFNENFFFLRILNEGKSFVTISRCGVSLWDLQTISNGCSPSRSWSVQTAEMEVLGDYWSRFHADKYQIVLVASNGNKVIMFVMSSTILN